MLWIKLVKIGEWWLKKFWETDFIRRKMILVVLL